MGKLVVLKLGEGNFEQGFPVILQIGVDGYHPFVETVGRLPPALEILEHYHRWHSAYCRLGTRLRLSAFKAQVTNISVLEDCSSSAQALSISLNAWLNSEPFRSIREKLLEKLIPSDQVRVILQTEDHRLRRLPWHAWDFFERYPSAEIALSTPVYERAEVPGSERPVSYGEGQRTVRILAILGSSDGIDIQADRRLLERLPGVEIKFLVEPQLKELTDQLWEQGWDILFFAGHSSSQADGVAGQIQINQTDSLTIHQLKYALKKGIESGLKLAIFNSCDGLGLAYSLAELRIPQLIVMREPIPDRVAQEFLKYFLGAFASGESFYIAVREARQRLQGLEDQFPGATWLPMICQNPAEIPLTWRALRNQTELDGLQPTDASPGSILRDSPGSTLDQRRIWFSRHSFRAVLSISIVVTAFVMGVRQLGVLQPLELQVFDQLLQLRSPEDPDPRLLVVTVTAADIQAQNQEPRRGSLSDRSLNQLLEKLEQHHPRAIGLDIYRDYAVGSNYQNLATRMRHDHLVGVCKASDPEADDLGVKPPPEISADRLGFSDLIIDPDGILRRHLLTLTSEDPASPCTTPYGFSVQLAARYLAAEGVSANVTSEGHLQFGNTVFKPLETRPGAYRQADTRGDQVLLNYRSSRSPQTIAPQVTLTQVLKGEINPGSINDRIVLIGVTDRSYPDYHRTPYNQQPGQEMSGVLIQAQMTSQILSAVLDQRPLLWFWPQWGDILWVWSWSLLGGILAWRFRSLVHLGLGVGITLGVLYGLCLGLITQGGWVPLVPSSLALIATSSGVVIYRLESAAAISMRSPNHDLDEITPSTENPCPHNFPSIRWLCRWSHISSGCQLTTLTQMPVAQPRLKLGLESQAFNRLQANLKFILPSLPRRRTPGRPRGAASRGECPSVSKPLTALVPASEGTLGNGVSKNLVPPAKSVLGLTTAEYPTFWFYVPYALTAERSVEFVLLDDQNNYVYKTTFVANGTSPGIVSFRLPSTVAPLKINQMYHWYFLVNCDADSPIFVEGWVQRITLNPILARQLEAATPRRRVDLYATNGVWYEALTTLAELHRAAPDDAKLTADWATLLQAVDLGDITSEPIVQCCTPKEL